MVVYNHLCDEYSKMAVSSYHSFLTAQANYDGQDWPKDSLAVPFAETQNKFSNFDEMLGNAISAVIFQALAIEAYVNLFGAIELGDQRFYSEIEPPKDQRPKNHRYLSTTEKLRKICELSSTCSSYPEDHLQKINRLFDKRDRLVHTKPHAHDLSPKPYDYVNPENNYRDIVEMHEEIAFVFENLSDEMKLYSQLREHVKAVRGAEHDFGEEQYLNIINQMETTVREMFKDEGEK